MTIRARSSWLQKSAWKALIRQLTGSFADGSHRPCERNHSGQASRLSTTAFPRPSTRSPASRPPMPTCWSSSPGTKPFLVPLSAPSSKAIWASCPTTTASVIRLPFPALTEERRRELVKQCKMYAEEARVAVRNARRDANTAIEKAKKEDSLPEDEAKRAEADIQKITDKYIAQVDATFKKKEEEVMAI